VKVGAAGRANGTNADEVSRGTEAVNVLKADEVGHANELNADGVGHANGLNADEASRGPEAANADATDRGAGAANESTKGAHSEPAARREATRGTTTLPGPGWQTVGEAMVGGETTALLEDMAGGLLLLARRAWARSSLVIGCVELAENTTLRHGLPVRLVRRRRCMVTG